jgi:glycosyltransferase involved in cell wall biosynthesis
MRLLYYFFELDTPMYQWQRHHIIDELEKNGHSIIIYNPAKYGNYEQANENLIKYIRNTSKKFDLFLTSDDSSILFRETLLEIKKIGLPMLLICWDNIELPYKHKKIADIFDVIWLTSIETKYLFEKWNCKKIVFQPYAANPFFFRPYWKNTINQVGFIGSPYGSRTNKLNDILKKNIPCSLHSDSLFKKGYNTSIAGVKKLDICDLITKTYRYMRFPIGRKVLYAAFKNQILQSKSRVLVENEFLTKEYSVPVTQMMSLYSNYALSLNIMELRDTYVLKQPVMKIHLRAFEIPMCGGLQLVSYNKELSSYFEANKEIIFYTNIDDMTDKCKFYLNPNNETIVFKLKKAARKRAETEHTWNNRFEKIFKLL